MATTSPLALSPLIVELQDILRPHWAEMSDTITAPVCEGDPDPDPDPDPKDPPDPDPDPDPETKVTPDDDWKAKARKHERALKAERKTREELERKLNEREESEKSETEKAIEKAREEARKEALSEAEKERRADRLEVGVTRLATKGFEVEVKDGDETKKQTVKFADPDDALVHIERALAKGDLDDDEIFDSEGKVNTDALSEALGTILKSKTHLQAEANGTPRPKPGAADAGKGGGTKELESLTPEDHAKRKYGSQSSTVEPARSK